jgi:hypothetical protein
MGGVGAFHVWRPRCRKFSIITRSSPQFTIFVSPLAETERPYAQ